MISHFGINPVRGGRPPSDIRVIIIIRVRAGDSIHVVPVS